MLANNARTTRDPDVLSEAVRQSMARTITNLYRHDDNRLHVFTLDAQLEASLKNSLSPTEAGLNLNVSPTLAQELIRKSGKQMEDLAANGYQPVLLCAREVRLALRRLMERTLPNLAIIAFSEISPNIQVQAHGVVELEEA